MDRGRFDWVQDHVVVLTGFCLVVLALDQNVAQKAFEMLLKGLWKIDTHQNVAQKAFKMLQNGLWKMNVDEKAATLLTIFYCIAVGFVGQLAYSIFDGNSQYDKWGLTKNKLQLLERQPIPRNMGVVVSDGNNSIARRFGRELGRELIRILGREFRRDVLDDVFVLINDWFPVVSTILDVVFGLPGTIGTTMVGAILKAAEKTFLKTDEGDGNIVHNYGGVVKLNNNTILISMSLKSPKLVAVAIDNTRGDADIVAVNRKLKELGKTVVAAGKKEKENSLIPGRGINRIRNLPQPANSGPNYKTLSRSVKNSRPLVLLAYSTALIMQQSMILKMPLFFSNVLVFH